VKKAINIGLTALMVFAIGACGGEKTVTIGKQVWMAKNLNDASKGGKCYDDKPENCEKYGRLYTWEEATKACPSGWHLPSKEEWQTLVDLAGERKVAGGKLKAKNGWNDYYGESGNGTDEYGFSTLPGGFGEPVGSFFGVGNFGFWWSATESSTDTDYAYHCDVGYGNSKVGNYSYDKSYLLSVRCVKD